MSTTFQERVQRQVERLHVTFRIADLRGHHVLRQGRFLLTAKRPAFDGKVILWFENAYAGSGDGWNRVGRDGVIRIPATVEEAAQLDEHASYSLYLWKW